MQAAPEEIAFATAKVLQHTVPCSVPGITFLSGGMSEEESSICLSLINNAPGPLPWSLSFSYGRAMQKSCLNAWRGKDENRVVAQLALLDRGRANSLAQQGQYAGGIAGEGVKAGSAAVKLPPQQGETVVAAKMSMKG